MSQPNPFEDPEVQQFSDGGAYDQNYDDNTSGGAAPPRDYAVEIQAKAANAATNMAIDAAKAKASAEIDAIKEDKARTDAATANQNAPPETPGWCLKCFAWLPIRHLAWFGALCFIILPWIDIVLNTGKKLDFTGFFILLYLSMFGFVATISESPAFRCTRSWQLSFFFWMRFLSRMWGRAFFYIFISILSYTPWADGYFAFSGLVGVYMMIVAILMYIISYTAAKKYVRMYTFVVAGTEGDEARLRFERKFDELDMDQDGFIGSESIVKLATEASRTLTNAERHAIQTFFWMRAAMAQWPRTTSSRCL